MCPVFSVAETTNGNSVKMLSLVPSNGREGGEISMMQPSFTKNHRIDYRPGLMACKRSERI